jgi:hypothetical protein
VKDAVHQGNDGAESANTRAREVLLLIQNQYTRLMQPICSHATDMIRTSPNVREQQTGQFQRGNRCSGSSANVRERWRTSIIASS